MSTKKISNFANVSASPFFISNPMGFKYFKQSLTEEDIVNVLSDIKHRIFPRPFERLSPLRGKNALVGVEIGVCSGEHALSLIRTLDIKRLYLIDPYELYNEYSEGKVVYGINQPSLQLSEINAKLLLEPYSDRLIWIKKLSSDAIRDINENIDFCYIDGNHEHKFVQNDILKYFSLLKTGGVIGGHDYYNGFQSEHDGVIDAVNEWTTVNRIGLKIELPDWWAVKT